MLIRAPADPSAPAQAILCTDLDRAPGQTVAWFVRRWRIEKTDEDVRAHLVVETQRQWSDRNHARTTPCLLDLFSTVTLLAAHLHDKLAANLLSAVALPAVLTFWL